MSCKMQERSFNPIIENFSNYVKSVFSRTKKTTVRFNLPIGRLIPRLLQNICSLITMLLKKEAWTMQNHHSLNCSEQVSKGIDI